VSSVRRPLGKEVCSLRKRRGEQAQFGPLGGEQRSETWRWGGTNEPTGIEGYYSAAQAEARGSRRRQ
jgi:hypothetical protein